MRRALQTFARSQQVVSRFHTPRRHTDLPCTSFRASSALFSATKYTETSTPPPDLERAGTADLCDVYHPQDVGEVGEVAIAHPIFRDYGGKQRFSGKISTVKCGENNPLVRRALEEQGVGRVLVVDGGGSLRCALLGDNLAEMAVKNGWKGVILNACIRDSEEIQKMAVGVKAINTHPLKSSKKDPGLRDVPVTFAGVEFVPGQYVYADQDGVLVSKKELGKQT